jgi:putative tryptophan/tyrosine transport system substrate-binding protein
MHFDRLKRREFVTLLGSATAAWPSEVRAQPPTIPVIGFIGAGSPGPQRQVVAAFYRGLKDVGYIESENLRIEYRWAEGQYDRLPAFAALPPKMNSPSSMLL